MFLKYLIFSFACLRFSIGENVDDLIVQLVKPSGKIRGHELESAKGRKFYAFQQIPYAQPPVGEYRFEAPEWHDPWDGILNCTENTKMCYQTKENFFKLNELYQTKESRVEESEDCLYMNVYTPVKPGSNNKLPVFLNIHGGAFIVGSGGISPFGPKYLIDGDIVIVTMNYRLGPFGFLSTGDEAISGNMGFKDQHLAIQWTYNNIHLFGGNPKDIVLGGESAGGFSAGYHLLNPKSAGLISAYMQQSGSPLSVEGISLEPRKTALELGRVLDPTIPDNNQELVNILKKASPEEIIDAVSRITKPSPAGFIHGLTWIAVIEDENNPQAFLTSPMYEQLLKENFDRVPCFIGFNSEESLYFFQRVEPIWQTYAALYDNDPSLVIMPSINVENRTLAGEKLKEVYTSLTFQEDLGAFLRFTSDAVFIRGIIRQAELTSAHVPVYLHQFSAGANNSEEHPGVPHADDLFYLWDFNNISVNEGIREILLKLYWNFIIHKNPTPEKDPVLQNIEWPTVGQENVIYLNLNDTLSIETNPRNYNKIKKILEDYMIPPFYVF